MNVSRELTQARGRAGLSQVALAARTGTSQATISAYESGRKRPSVDTLNRLLAACGSRLRVSSGAQPLIVPSARRHARSARSLLDVLALAEALPTRHETALHFPRLAGS